MNQRKNDVEYQRTNNAIAKHVEETNQQINWGRGRVFRTGKKERTQKDHRKPL